jgi:hypothetical protein
MDVTYASNKANDICIGMIRSFVSLFKENMDINDFPAIVSIPFRNEPPDDNTKPE